MAMTSFNQAGVSYRGPQSNWAADKAYFKSIKSPNARFPIRILAQTAVPIPWALGTPSQAGNGNFDYWRQCAMYFASDPAFDVIFSVYYGPITADSWQAMHDAVVAEASYLQSQGVSLDFCVANELEGTYGIAFAASSLSANGSTGTLVAASPFPTHVGDAFTIYGSNIGALNTTQTVASYDGNKTITFNTTATGTNTGGAFAISLSLPQLNARLRQLASDVKAVYTLGKVSYGCFDATVNGVGAFADWQTNGLGGLDVLSIHTYPNTQGKVKTMKAFNKSNANALTLLSALGTDKVYVSEFGISSGGMSGMATMDIISGMRNIVSALSGAGVKKALVWSWNGLLGTDDNFEMMRYNGTYSPAWGVLLANNGRQALTSTPVSQQRSVTQTVRTGAPTNARSISGSRTVI